jgi:broad specificity phosphatase PhoE
MRRFSNNYSNILHHPFSIVNNVRNRLKRKLSTVFMDTTSLTTESVTNHSNINWSVVTKDIWIIRHGQAVHNPRAEYARDVLQCSHDEFLSIMEEDDCFDAPLTTLGIQQAQQIYTQYGESRWWGTPSIIHGGDIRHDAESTSLLESKRHPVELVVSSPLSRALRTAELALGDVDHIHHQKHHHQSTHDTIKPTNRVCYEGFREINGWLQNGKRHTRIELEKKFPTWDFSLLSSNEDDQWTPTLETTDSCMERGYDGLLWIMKDRPERSIVLVSHGALLKYTLTDHPNVILRDGRKPTPE